MTWNLRTQRSLISAQAIIDNSTPSERIILLNLLLANSSDFWWFLTADLIY